MRVKGIRGKLVDKTRVIHNNPVMARETCESMLAEFSIAKDLQHPSIIEYKYFMRKHLPEKKCTEFHILLEQMEGDDMSAFLNEQGRPFSIDRVRDVCG